MSEAVETNPYYQIGDAFVIAKPDVAFSDKLEKFYSDTRRQLGGRALTLVSDSHLRVFREPLTTEFKAENPDIITPKELSAMQSNLRRRGPIRPIVDEKVGIEPERDKYGDVSERPGIVLRFNVLVDKLTAQAIRSSWLVDSELAIAMHLTVPREHLRMGTELLEARDELLTALRGKSPLTVENLHLSSPNVHI